MALHEQMFGFESFEGDAEVFEETADADYDGST